MAQELHRPINRVRNALRIDGRNETPEDTAVNVLLKDEADDVLMAYGSTVPIDDEEGFAKGCIFIDTSGGVATTFYVNEGDEDDCDFNVSAGGASTEFTALTDTPNSYALSANKLVKVNDAADALEFVAAGGDATMNAAGEFTLANDSVGTDQIEDLAVNNAKIATAAAIAWTKMAALADASILIGDGTNVPVARAISGHASLANDGALTVNGFSLAGAAHGDIIYINASGGPVLLTPVAGRFLKSNGAGVNPEWDIPSVGVATTIANGCKLEDGGVIDSKLIFTQQTVSQPELTIPNFAGVNDTFAFVTLAQTLANKKLTAPTLVTPNIDDDGANFQYKLVVSALAAHRNITLPLLTGNDTFVFEAHAATLDNKKLIAGRTLIVDATDATKELGFDLSGATTSTKLTLISSQTVNRSITLPDAACTLVGKDTTDELRNKTLIADSLTLADETDETKVAGWDLSGATTGKKLTLISAHTVDRSITYPDATDTLVGRETTDTLKGKSIAAGDNTITGLNAEEAEAVAPTTGAHGMPVIITAVNTGAGTLSIFNANAPFKFRILNVWAVATKACNGNWKLNNGANDITENVAYGVDKAVSRVGSVDDAYHEIAANGSLNLISSDVTDTAIVYIQVLRIT